jgi:hypothetical protein
MARCIALSLSMPPGQAVKLLKLLLIIVRAQKVKVSTVSLAFLKLFSIF